MYSPRRIVLDNLLVEAAREAGAEILEATTFRDLLWAEGRVVGARLQDANGCPTEESVRMVCGLLSRARLAPQPILSTNPSPADTPSAEWIQTRDPDP